MVKFARLILAKMHGLTKELETRLGPDTGDLSLRVGIHSGSVTGGLLRSERARFQLFGDTMNVASRIESTGEAGRIHVSPEAADRLVGSGKGHWLVKRSDPVHAKGKGDIHTYFIASEFKSNERGCTLSTSKRLSRDSFSSPMQENELHISGLDQRSRRLVEWNVEMLVNILKQVVARRQAVLAAEKSGSSSSLTKKSLPSLPGDNHALLAGFKTPPLDEVKETIHFPEFDSKAAIPYEDDVTIPTNVINQLREYVTTLATMYNPNEFHNFEHASHVTMSVIKLLSRIAASTDLLFLNVGNDPITKEGHGPANTLHDHTYGIVRSRTTVSETLSF